MTETETLLGNGYFARHETFCPRYGWLKKGFDGVSEDPGIFDRADAIEMLGVGKNMVRAIRFWCFAFKLIEPEQDSGPQRLAGPVKPAELGKQLLSDENGWDPFLEDPASLWLLHWQLFTPPLTAASWSFAFNLNKLNTFTLKTLSRAMTERKSEIPALARYSDSSVEKDASCFIRMYAPGSKQVSEETECPFIHLNLLFSDDKRQSWHFNMGNKTTLPDLIFLGACFDYAHHFQPHLKSLSLNKIAYGFNSPGTVFKLSESDAGHRLEKAARHIEGVTFAESYGTRQLFFEQDLQELYWHTLNRYYENSDGTGFIK